MVVELAVVRFVDLKVDKEVSDRCISTIVKMTANFIFIIGSDCFNINQDWIINGRSVVVNNRNSLREFINFSKLIG